MLLLLLGEGRRAQTTDHPRRLNLPWWQKMSPSRTIDDRAVKVAATLVDHPRLFLLAWLWLLPSIAVCVDGYSSSA